MFAVAESFVRSSRWSVLAGVVMRRDLVVDGMAFGRAAVGGDDATDAILAMHRSLGRSDINCILLGGLVMSMYNIVDGERVAAETELPVVAVTFEDSQEGVVEGAIRHHFGDAGIEAKLAQYRRLGRRDRTVLKTGKPLYIRCWGTTTRQAMSLLNAFTLQGALPEPVKVAKVAARAAAAAFAGAPEKG